MKTKTLFTVQFVIVLILSSGAFLQLLKDGGARPESSDYYVPYSGILNYIPHLVTIASITILLLSNRPWAILFKRSNVFAWTLFFTAAISSANALFPVSSYSLLFLLIGNFCIAFLAPSYLKLEETLHLLTISALGIAFSSVLFSLYIPSYGIAVGQHQGLWQGVFPHKNSLGLFSTAASCLALINIAVRTHQVSSVILLIATGVLSFKSGSTTSLISMLALILATTIIYATAQTLQRFRVYFASGLMAAGFLFVLFFDKVAGFDFLGNDSSFSKRDQIWDFVREEISASPIFGHGLQQFSALNLFDDNYSRLSVGFSVLSTHNGFFDILYSLGVFGAIAFSVYFVQVSFRCKKPDHFIAFAILSIGFVIFSFLESTLFSNNLFLFVLFVIHSYTSRLTTDNAYKQNNSSTSDRSNKLF